MRYSENQLTLIAALKISGAIGLVITAYFTLGSANWIIRASVEMMFPFAIWYTYDTALCTYNNHFKKKS